MNGFIWRQEAEGVTTNVAKHTGIRIVKQHLIESCIDITMATALTECRWTGGYILAWCIIFTYLHTQCFFNKVRIQLARTRQFTCETPLDNRIAWHDTTNLILNKGLSLFGNQHIFAIIGHATNQFLRNRILRNFQYGERTAIGEALHQVVKSDTAGNNTQFAILSIYILVIFTLNSHLFQQRLLSRHDVITLTGKGRQQYPTGSLGIIVQIILLTRFISTYNNCTAMSHSRCDAHQDWQMQLF